MTTGTKSRSSRAKTAKAPAGATRKTAAKPATARKTTTRKSAVSATPKAAAPVEPVSADNPVETPDKSRPRDLLDAVAARSPEARSDLKIAMELILEEMGKLLDKGEEVVLPPLGKLSVKKRVPRGDATMLTVKLRRPGPTGGAA